MNIDKLNNIKKVEAPDAIFERLQQRIENAKQDTLPTSKAMLLSTAFVLLILMNVLFILNNKSANQPLANNNNLLQELELTANSNMYYE